jgi:hypothetical protein
VVIKIRRVNVCIRLLLAEPAYTNFMAFLVDVVSGLTHVETTVSIANTQKFISVKKTSYILIKDSLVQQTIELLKITVKLG